MFIIRSTSPETWIICFIFILKLCLLVFHSFVSVITWFYDFQDLFFVIYFIFHVFLFLFVISKYKETYNPRILFWFIFLTDFGIPFVDYRITDVLIILVIFPETLGILVQTCMASRASNLLNQNWSFSGICFYLLSMEVYHLLLGYLERPNMMKDFEYLINAIDSKQRFFRKTIWNLFLVCVEEERVSSSRLLFLSFNHMIV